MFDFVVIAIRGLAPTGPGPVSRMPWSGMRELSGMLCLGDGASPRGREAGPGPCGASPRGTLI